MVIVPVPDQAVQVLAQVALVLAALVQVVLAPVAFQAPVQVHLFN